MRYLIIFFILQLCEARTWTSSSGSTVEADLISLIGEKIALKTPEGKTLNLKFFQLSEADQNFLRAKSLEQNVKNGKAGKISREQEGVGWQNWDTPWPTNVRVSQSDFEIIEDREASKDGAFIYLSPHFSFQSSVQLSRSLVKKFAWYFETTHRYLEKIPLSFSRTQEKERHKIVLVETEKEYQLSGGLPGSAGVYLGSKDVVLVPLTSVGVKKVGSRYTIDYNGSNSTLSHEIVHSLTDSPYFNHGALGWFTEGIAEYIAHTPYRSGIYMQSKALFYIEPYVVAYGKYGDGGRNLGRRIEVGALKEFMLQSYDEFRTIMVGEKYGVAALLVAYFCDLKREDEAQNLQAFLKALKAGKKGEEALNVLLNGRSFKELEAIINKAWRSKGVELIF